MYFEREFGMWILFGLATFNCLKCGTMLCDTKKTGSVLCKYEFFAMFGS